MSVKAATPLAVKAPVITSPLAASGWASGAFTYPICASNDPAEVTATGLPKGLSLNPITGVISGIPAAPGVLRVRRSPGSRDTLLRLHRARLQADHRGAVRGNP
ncbi:MAG: Ig domain-containing protein [Acidobacteriota bacterium]